MVVAIDLGIFDSKLLIGTLKFYHKNFDFLLKSAHYHISY